jgi:hypothetical protein
MVALAAGDHAGALARFRESLVLIGPRGPKGCVALCLEGVAAAAGAAGDAARAVRAARLFGTADALRQAASVPMEPGDRPGYERPAAAVRARVGEAAWTTAWDEGHEAPPERGVTEALSLAEESTPRHAAAQSPADDTARGAPGRREGTA